MRMKVLSFTLCVLLFALCTPVGAQQANKIPRIGYLTGMAARDKSLLAAFQQGLQELGYFDGKNIVIEQRYGKRHQRHALAAELVRLKVDIIVMAGGGVRAAKKATSTIPIVMWTSSDPVRRGLVASLARPGGNITGFGTLSPELLGKRLELLKETFPLVSRVAVLTGRANPSRTTWLEAMEHVAKSLALQLQILEVRKPKDFDAAFEAASKGQVEALIELPSRVFHGNGRRLVAFAAKRRIPAVFHTRDFVEVGGLMSYGTNYPDLLRRAATFVHKILKGAKPGDLPIEQPTKFDLVINLKTAKQIGVTIPPEVLYRADKVIR